MITPRQLQFQHEVDSDTEAAAARLEELRLAAAKGDVNLPRANKFLARAYSAVKESLTTQRDVVRRGSGAKYANWLRSIDMNVASVIAIREAISQLSGAKTRSKPITIQSLGMSIGRMYELEVRIKEAETVNPMYMQKMHDQVKERNTTAPHHLRRVYQFAYEQVMKEHADTRLTAPETIQLGKFGVQACTDAGLIRLTKAQGQKGKMYHYELEDDVLEFLTDYTNKDVQGIMDSSAGAMMCPPDPWTTLVGGGYLSPRRKQQSTLMAMHGIRKSERARLRAAFTAEEMPEVFKCANYLQSIALTLHKPALACIRGLWEQGGGVLGVPRKNPPAKPVCPLPETWVKADGSIEELEVFYAWKRAAVQWYADSKEWRSKVRELGSFLRISAKTSGAVWMPVFFDSRGRWYYRSNPNPQGSDISKAVLHFHEKKPLGKRGLYWLKVAVANNFGFDKERFDARAAWTDANWHLIKGALEHPADAAAVFGTDAPWSMYSAAYELHSALSSDDPEAYCTGVPVHMDATCSGLQHFSAMLNDHIGGRFVNLYDDQFVGPKQDIYGEVAHNALKALRRDLDSKDEEVKRYAALWLEYGIPRNLAKGPVMTYVYGATLRGVSEDVQTYVEGDVGAGFWPADLSPFKCSMYLARKLFQGIAYTVPASEACMHWLKEVARQMPNGKRMEWTTPTGFKVQHDYQGFDEIIVRLRSCGVTQAVVREFNDTTRLLPMQNAIAPNFVHALDASHLTRVANRMSDEGLSMVAIHDSFGTHPCDVDRMHCIIREEFHRMYTEHNVLGEFLWEVGALGEVPAKGTLDLSLVLDSEFFFC